MSNAADSRSFRMRQAHEQLRPFGASIGGNSELPGPASLAKRLSWWVITTANRLVPKAPGRIVLHSTIDLEDGVLSLIDEAGARGYRVIVLLEEPSRAPQLRALTSAPVTTVARRSLRGLLHYLRSPHIVITQNLFGDPRPPRSQVVVNIWHGDPPGGKVNGRFSGGSGAYNATYAPVSSTLGRAYRAAEFGLSPLQVPVVGAARNDRMLRADRTAVRRALLGAEDDRTTFLWLPSFRTGHWGTRVRSDVATVRHPGVPFAPEDVRRLDEWLVRRGARLVVKLHPHDVASFPGGHEAIQVLTQEEMEAAGLTVYTLLPAFDGLITDVSSVWVDYLLLDRPMVFAFPDVQDYRDGRGLNVEPFEEWVPGPFARTMDELIDSLGDLVDGRDPMGEERRRALARFHHHHDDGSTARLLDGLGLVAGEARR